ncbi:MAG TPA: gamma-glutamyltransferase [Bryobacteraceae bacterium]|nr:gamma-glutamyltransferase [Bryobacteraceae bacterium]
MCGKHPFTLAALFLSSLTGSLAQPVRKMPVLPPDIMPQRAQARSMVITPLGIVSTGQTLASEAGAAVLARGGSAMDAAIAANAAIGVVEYMNNGIGGDLFAIYYEAKTGKVYGMNASGWSAKGMTLEYLRKKGYTQMPHLGIDSVTVPGCVDGWSKMHQRFGRLPWRDLFQPAIYYAEHGFPLTEVIHDRWRSNEPKIALDDEGARLFLPGGRAPKVGDVFRNPDLARTLALLAAGGSDAFYRGPIAAAILKTSESLEGVLDRSDLADYQAEWVEPISTTYRGWKVYELPPNGQGMAALEMLNVMEQFPISNYPLLSAPAFHWEIEAQKIAYQDLLKYLADPRFAQIPVTGLISKEYAARRAREIDSSRANCSVRPGKPELEGHGDTIYLTAVDKDGNIVSLIQSLFNAYGSAVVVRGMGFHLQNRGGLFVFDPKEPNVVGPRKRTFHTIIPAFMERGPLHIGFGIMGGLNQAQAHAQFVSSIVDHSLNIQAAIEAPRFTKLDFSGCDVLIESRIPPLVLEQLRAKGHNLSIRGPYSGDMGGGHVVLHDSAAHVNYGASSPRQDGAAAPETPDFYSKKGK